MNEKTITELQALCLVSLQLAQESENAYELRNLILGICKQLESIIDDAEIDNDYKKSKRD